MASIDNNISIINNHLENEIQLYWLLEESNDIIQIINIIIKFHKNKNNVSNNEKDLLKKFFLKLHDRTIKHSFIMIIFIDFMRLEIEPQHINKVIDALYINNKNKMTQKEKLLHKIDCNHNIKIFTQILQAIEIEKNNIDILIKDIKKNNINTLKNKSGIRCCDKYHDSPILTNLSSPEPSPLGDNKK